MDFKLSDLAAPFAYEDIEWRAGATNKDKTQALALAYITSRAVMNRLDEVCGPQNWQDDFRSGPDGGVLAGIGIRIGDEWIWKWDGAENSSIEAVKGGLSDAFKRAAVKWGIGRYLYGLDGVWVKCETRGNTVVLSRTDQPKLPAWALPKAEHTNGHPAQDTIEGEISAETIGDRLAAKAKGRPYKPETLKNGLAQIAERKKGATATDAQRALMVGMLDACYMGDANQRHTALAYLTGHASSKDLTSPVVLALLDWLKPTRDENGDYRPSDMAITEATSAYTAALEAQGQKAML